MVVGDIVDTIPTGGQGRGEPLEATYRVVDERYMVEPIVPRKQTGGDLVRNYFTGLLVMPLVLMVGIVRVVLFLTRMAFALVMLLGLVGGGIFLATYGLVQIDGSLRWAGYCGVMVVVGWVGGFTVGYIEALLERARSAR